MEGFMEEWRTNGNKPEMWRSEGLEFQQDHREGPEWPVDGGQGEMEETSSLKCLEQIT